jgi:hypothetical protein
MGSMIAWIPMTEIIRAVEEDCTAITSLAAVDEEAIAGTEVVEEGTDPVATDERTSFKMKGYR